MKRIIILDDHCQDNYFYLLQDYLDAINKYLKNKHNEPADFVKCPDVREFADIILADASGEYDGWIVDMMVPTEGLANYALLGRPDIVFNTARSGILALLAVTDHGNPMNDLSSTKKSKLVALANRPVLIFSILKKANLAREMRTVGINNGISRKIFPASKTEIDVVDLNLSQDVQTWCDKVAE